MTRRLHFAGRAGFSLVELLVVIGILVILFSIFVPYVAKVRENDHRARCAENLRNINSQLQAYASGNSRMFPRVVYDPAHNPNGYNAFTAYGSTDPFDPNTLVRPNDVTASLWLLVRAGLVQPSAFVCPSTSDTPEPADLSDFRKRSNFSGSQHLSYSYASPFSSAPGYSLNVNTLAHDFAVMADKNPGIDPQTGSNVISPAFDAPPFELALANSNNHGRSGQNVLYADGHVAFSTTPYCGYAERDNIYTALQPSPIPEGQKPPAQGKGVLGHDVGPAWDKDSYLVPTDQDH